MGEHAFDRALRFERLDAARVRGATVPEYGNFTGQFGGITAATLLKAVTDRPEAAGAPVSLTVNYTAAVKPGPFEVETRAIRLGRTLQHWSAEMRQGETIAGFAVVTLGARKEGFRFAPLLAPAAPPPETLAPLDGTGWTGWATQYEFRFAEGAIDRTRGPEPFAEPQSPRSLLCIRHRDPRPLDFAGLACLSDAFFVRMIQVRNTFPAMATVSLTTQFHCDKAMLAAHGDDWVLCDVDTRVFRDNFHDQTATLWSKNGALLASSHQMVWFAE
jgi:acyl-CoA thioesterase